MRAKRGRNSATAVLGGICLARRTHLMRLILATRGDCRRRVAYPGASVQPSTPVQTWRGQAGCAQSSPVGGKEMVQFAITSGEPVQGTEVAASPFRAQKWRHAVLDSGAAPRWAVPECYLSCASFRNRRAAWQGPPHLHRGPLAHGRHEGGLERCPCPAPVRVGCPVRVDRRAPTCADGSG